MHIHILGICGTFMAGIAVLAKQQGHTVTEGADVVVFYQPEALNWSLDQVAKSLQNAWIFNQIDALIQHVVASANSNDHILIMSNGSFENIHARLLTALT
ncbi:MAG: Mur ligase domain-containing protein [Pseudomonadota bacterium]